MDTGQLFGRGVGFPLHVGSDGRVAWSAGEPNIRESIQIILMTEPGERLYRPDFGAGLGQLLFEPNTVTTHQLIRDRISKALARWEPRILVESIHVMPDADDPQAAIATITYRLVATQSREQMSLAVTLNGAAER